MKSKDTNSVTREQLASLVKDLLAMEGEAETFGLGLLQATICAVSPGHLNLRNHSLEDVKADMQELSGDMKAFALSYQRRQVIRGRIIALLQTLEAPRAVKKRARR